MGGRLTVLASGSSANGYIIQADNEVLILEAGVPFKECAKALCHDISNVRAVITTHGHIDHAKYIPQYKKHGLRVYCTPICAAVFDCYYMRTDCRYIFGGFKVSALKVPHGDCQCYSYVIDHPSFGRLAFITDAESFPYALKGCNHILCEANYSDDIRIDAMLNGAELRAQSRNHMEIGETIRTIKRLKSPELSSIILLHLSDGLSNAEDFKRRIFNECGVKAEVADENKTFVLRKEEF